MSPDAHCSPLLNFDWDLLNSFIVSPPHISSFVFLIYRLHSSSDEYGKNYEFLLCSFAIENEDGCLLINLPLTDIFVKNVTEA